MVIAKLFESGGSNAHFKTLIAYLGAENMILVLENSDELTYLQNITSSSFYKIKVMPRLAGYVELHHLATTNVRKLAHLAWSIFSFFVWCVFYRFPTVTVSVVEPEKHLWLFLLPFIKVNYILHTEPACIMNMSTAFICNSRLNNLKTITTVSQSMKRAITKNWLIEEKQWPFIHLVYNCIIEPDLSAHRGSHHKSSLYVTTLGHVSNRKNPNVWLEVAKSVTSTQLNTEFIWLGNGELLKHFKQLTENLPRISFMGLSVDTQFFLEQTDIYYQPSIIEPQGIAVLEAMYNCLPCVVSSAGGLPESVINGFNGIVVPFDDVEANVAAVTMLLQNEDIRSLYGRNSGERYRQNFTYENFISAMDLIYKAR